MAIQIICVGKLKEKALRDLCNDYLKRTGRFVKIAETELPDLAEPEGASEKEQEIIMNREGEKILSRIQSRDYVIAMAIEGETLASVSLSEKMDALAVAGQSHLVFVIGGSLGLSDAVKKRANFLLSMSKMTFPHGLARLMLYEQLYRAHKILAGERYHK